MSRAPKTDWSCGALAWWQVRDPLLTPQQPTQLPVRVLSFIGMTKARVEVEHLPGTVRDPERLPGERFTVNTRKLTPRTARPRDR